MVGISRSQRIPSENVGVGKRECQMRGVERWRIFSVDDEKARERRVEENRQKY